MKLFGQKRLDQFARKHPQFRSLLSGFRSITLDAVWKGQHEIPSALSTALKGNRILFRLGQSCRIVAEIEFATDKSISDASKNGESPQEAGMVLILKTWTHEEYNSHLNDWWQ